MFGSYVDAAIEPADCPSIKADAVEYFFVAQGGKELILLNERQAVEDTLAAIVEGKVQPIVIECMGGCDPFE